MSNPIVSINAITPLAPLDQPKAGANSAGEGEFTRFLADALNKLDQSQAQGEQAAVALVQGDTDDFHTPVIAMEKASLTLGLAVTVRNKVLDAYHEVMRMQI